MGGIVLTGSMPKLNFLTAAVIMCTPIEPIKAKEEMAEIYQDGFGTKLIGMWLDNKEVLTPEYKKKTGFDLVERINSIRKEGKLSLNHHDGLFLAPMFGYKG